MARRAFYSFHYKQDNWRAAKVRNMGVVEGNKPATDNDWEAIKQGGGSASKPSPKIIVSRPTHSRNLRRSPDPRRRYREDHTLYRSAGLEPDTRP